MALAKTDVIVDACQEIAQNVLLEGANQDIEPDYASALSIQLALTTETAHTGTHILVQTCSNEAGNDTDWVDLDEWVALVGTANQEALSGGGEPQGETVIVVADTTGYVTNGVWLFIEDGGAFADSEWVFQRIYAVNTSVTILDGLATAKDNADTFSNVAAARKVLLPFEAKQVRVIYNNCYDAAGSTIAIRSRIVEVPTVS